ncbi:hypothetical protein GGR56DRAFT_669585 [Xylariaceae sp. FL0804]|nr:hypothetical protein GGR56DRAFT_669585 [Xylariaceae sp. FL0804]
MGGGSGAGAPLQPGRKRVITAARREQNKLAQRSYRERQKALWERSPGRRTAHHPRQRRLEPRLGRDGISQSLLSAPTAELTERETTAPRPTPVAGDAYQQQQQQDPAEAADDAQPPLIRDQQPLASTAVVEPDAFDAPPPPPVDLLAGTATAMLGGQLPSEDRVPAVSYYYPNSSSWVSPTSDGTGTVDFAGTTATAPSFYPPYYLPLLAGLQDAATTVRLACLSNALCLGLDLARLATCGASCMSPFFRPTTTTTVPVATTTTTCASASSSSSLSSSSSTAFFSGGPAAAAEEQEALLPLLSSSASTAVPPSLRPTLAQVLIPHHASLDLIPLPALCERAILLSAAVPHLFSAWELKLDAFARGALAFRGGHGGHGHGAAQPWDAAGWVIAPWFWAKWRLLAEGVAMAGQGAGAGRGAGGGEGGQEGEEGFCL